MEYENRNGLNVIKNGWVVIEGVKHYVSNFFVVCNSSLNHKAWDTTKQEFTCSECVKIRPIKTEQLKLF